MSELDDVKTTVAVIDGLRSRVAELEAKYTDVVAEHENELALRLEAEAALADERMSRQMYYEKWQQAERGGKVSELPATDLFNVTEFTDDADCNDLACKMRDELLARIAKLEAALRYMTIERDSLTEDRDDLILEKKQAEAALAEMKGRRCGGCAHDKTCGVARVAWTQFGVQPFSCVCWTARAEEGSAK